MSLSEKPSSLPVRAPVVEAAAGAQPAAGERTLAVRLQQQALLARLGVLALQGSTFKELLDRTAHLTAEGLEAEFCKVMEFLPAKNCFIVRAGVGWDLDEIGQATVGADLQSPAGYALRTGAPVISNHLEREHRFRTPALLMKHGIRRAINVILQGERKAYGVLEVDSRLPGEFTEHDLAFLQGAANILGMAIERQRIERDLIEAAERQRLLFLELNHRVKNSLQIAVATLNLQAGASDDPKLAAALREASSRIVTLATAHEGLYRGGKVARIDLAAYLAELCQGLEGLGAGCFVDFSTPAGEEFEIETDRAIPVALILNELVTNAIKYAYPPGAACRVWVTLAAQSSDIVLTVRDQGTGLPAAFDWDTVQSLGMRLVRAFSRQIEGHLTLRRHDPGTEFALRFRGARRA